MCHCKRRKMGGKKEILFRVNNLITSPKQKVKQLGKTWYLCMTKTEDHFCRPVKEKKKSFYSHPKNSKNKFHEKVILPQNMANLIDYNQGNAG